MASTPNQAGLNLPVEVLWKKHRLYFTDASKRLRRINFNRQQVISLSGNGRPGYMNGNSRLTQFEGILGIAVKGKFAYVSDYQNDAIRQVRVR